MEERKPASRVKITVLKTLYHKDLVEEYVLPEKPEAYQSCYRFQVGDVFYVDGFEMPEGFCPWAWADIHREVVAIRCNADVPISTEPGCFIASCTDGLRPVVFKVERA